MPFPIALMTNEPADLFLGQLKSHVAMQPLGNEADVDRMLAVAEKLAAVCLELVSRPG